MPRDAQGNRPGWLWPLMDGEETLRAVGLVQSGDHWRLHARQSFRQWVPLDRGVQLYVHEKLASRTVLTGSTETTVVVAGAIPNRPSKALASPQAWTIADTLDFSHGRWQRHRMASTPVELTNVANWDLGWREAGHRNVRPVVSIAGIPASRPMVLATLVPSAARPITGIRALKAGSRPTTSWSARASSH